jgi:tRNA threonylcarbamoyladenosine biosynthesis protein TsaB
VILLAFDTATPATVVGVLLGDGRVIEARDDPPEGSRGEHASRLLPLVERALEEGGVGWDGLERIAVGVGPGGFTGLRIGIASARALAQARGLPLVPVSSLAALATGAAEAGGAPVVAAVIDARRGEVFAGAWRQGEQRLAPAALAPAELAARLRALEAPVQAVGDGAVRFRTELETAGVEVPHDGSAVHRIAAVPLCRLGAAGEPSQRDRLLPDYRREPDAKPQ